MSDAEIDAFHQKLVMVLTHAGVPISRGRISVSRAKGAAEPRVDLNFETDTMACSIGVPLENLPRLRDSFDGNSYTHRLPPGEKVWLADSEQSHAPVAEAGGPLEAANLVETFPLPPNARLFGFAGDKPGKRKT